MKNFGLIFCLGLALPLPIATQAFAEDAPCHTTVGKRVVLGHEPTADALYAQLRTIELGSWDSDFWVETFTYIGDVHTKRGQTFKLGNLKTVWGISCRATNRFFIFDVNNKVLGHYYGLIIDDPNEIVIKGDTVIFPFDPKDGNSLDLANGPPDEAWLDGDTEDFNPSDKKHTH